MINLVLENDIKKYFKMIEKLLFYGGGERKIFFFECKLCLGIVYLFLGLVCVKLFIYFFNIIKG